MLEAFADQKKLRKILGQYRPFPTIASRRPWLALPQRLRRDIVAGAKKNRGLPWPALPASLYLDFFRTGRREAYQKPYFERRSRLLRLMLAECMEDCGNFLDEIADGIWHICEESSWCIPAHVAVQKAGRGLPDIQEPILDLFAAESGALLAWLNYLLDRRLDGISALIRPRLRLEIDRRVLTPFLQRDDFWWMGLKGQRVNNWNPWIISNIIFCGLLGQDETERRSKIIAKAMRCLEGFLAPYPRDGGCDEGPAYWGRAGASLFECLEAIYRASCGAIDCYGEPLIREIGRFIYRVHIADRWFVNFADAPAAMLPNGALIYWFGKRIRDQEMQHFGRWCFQQSSDIAGEHIASPSRALLALFTWKELHGQAAPPPLPRDVWLPEIQVMVARSRTNSSLGLTIAAKGGHNAESHNHNDVGNFIVYADGQPVLIDVGVETYTAKTFSARRYEIWTMQSQYHNLPTVNNVMQQSGRQFCARAVAHSIRGDITVFELDLAPAYPPAAGINRWLRRLMLERPQVVVLEDSYELKTATRRLFLSLITPCQPRLSKGKVLLASRQLAAGRKSGRAQIKYDARVLSAKRELIRVADSTLASIWGKSLWRLIIVPRRRRAQGRIVLRISQVNL